MVDRRDTLRRLRREEVAIRRWPHDDIPPEYFHLVDASLPLVFGACGHAFEQDELDLVRCAVTFRRFSITHSQFYSN